MVIDTKKRNHTIKFLVMDSLQPPRLTVKLIGPQDTAIDSFSVTWDKVSATCREKCAMLGWANTIRDAGAASMGTEPRERFARMRKRAEYLDSGASEWSQRATGEGSLLFQALMRQNSKLDPEKVKAKLETWTKAQKDAMLLSDTLKPIVDQLRAEQGRDSGVQVDKLFSELDELAE